jgi:integrase/recombinase XerD
MGKRPGKRGGEPENLYQRDNGIWYARATVGGEEHRKSLQTRDRREAVRRRNKWLKELSPYHGTTRHTYMEAVAEWIEASHKQLKPKTRKRYAQSLTVLEPHFGALFWDQVTKAALQQFMKERLSAGTEIATINRDLTVISGIAKHVRELDGWPDDNPVERLPRKPRREKRSPYVRPPLRDIEAIFSRMKGTFGQLCTVALESGLRMDELRYLKRDDAMDGAARLYDQKNRLPAVVPWTAKARAIVEAQPAIPGSDYLFNTRNGGPYKRVTEMFREVVKWAQESAQKNGASFTRMRFHDLRHEFAIRYLENGGSLYRLKELLRHGTIAQTEWYLNYLTPEQAERAKIGSAQ